MSHLELSGVLEKLIKTLLPDKDIKLVRLMVFLHSNIVIADVRNPVLAVSAIY